VKRFFVVLAAIAVFLALPTRPAAQVPYERLLRAADDPGNWLTYSGSYASQRYSSLDQINPQNAKDLELKWVLQMQSLDKFQATPLVVDGIMYVTQPPNDVIALDARTGREFWIYEHDVPTRVNVCCGRVNRGLAILGDTLYMGTVDARLIALDSKTGRVLWDVEVFDYTKGYAVTVAPLAVKDKIIIGVAGGEFGIRGFIDAYDAKTGERAWRFYTIPGPGEPGHETWENDAWKTGGASIWVTGSYDPELNLTYWGIGNPAPDWNPEVRPGDNLYADSVLALDPDTGELKWYFQFTPHDEWDWDAVQVPVLVDREFRGKQRKLMLWGNRNGFFYVLDRVSGEFLLGKPFVKQDWAIGLDENGRPIKAPGHSPTYEGSKTYPGVQGGTNWYSPTYSPKTGLFYLSAWDDYYSYYFKRDDEYSPGNRYTGGGTRSPISPTRRQRFLTANASHDGYGAIRALDPETGDAKWEFKLQDVSDSGLVATAGNVILSGSREGHFLVLDATNGKLLWNRYLGGQVTSSPITYLVDDKQHAAVAAGHSLFVFGLRE
jgi:alcohol dehydrogenase (cytochrome c)